MIVGTATTADRGIALGLRQWADRGWLIYPFLEVVRSVASLKPLSVITNSQDPVGARGIVEMFDKYLPSLRSHARSRLGRLPLEQSQERVQFLDDALWAYSEARYSLVPPLAYSQSEGVLVSAWGVEAKALFSSHPTRVRQRLAAMEKYGSARTPPFRHISDAEVHAIEACVRQLSEPSSRSHVTRHRIAHGGLGFGSKTEAARSLLFYFAILRVADHFVGLQPASPN